MNFNMVNSQVGEGDIGLISHTMVRLIMAKILKDLEIDLTNFQFFIEGKISSSYYSVEERIDDIKDFLDYVNADYDFEDYNLIIHFPFKGEWVLEDIVEAFEYRWTYLEWEDVEDVIGAHDNSIAINLEEYEGIPTKFFIKYYEIMKEHITL